MGHAVGPYPVLAQQQREQLPDEHVPDGVARGRAGRAAHARFAVLDHTLLVGHTCKKNTENILELACFSSKIMINLWILSRFGDIHGERERGTVIRVRGS